MRLKVTYQSMLEGCTQSTLHVVSHMDSFFSSPSIGLSKPCVLNSACVQDTLVVSSKLRPFRLCLQFYKTQTS